MYSIHGYNAFFATREGRRSGGVAIYVTDQFEVDSAEILNMTTAEALHVQITYNNKLLSILGLYRSLDYDMKTYITELEPILNNITKSEIVYYTGDINLNILSESVDDYKALLGSMGYTSCINGITRLNENLGTCVDHIFIKCKKNELHSAIVHSDISDHFTILGVIPVNTGNNTANTVSKINNVKINYHKLRLKITRFNWDFVSDPSTNINDKFDRFLNSLKTMLTESSEKKKSFPVITKK